MALDADMAEIAQLFIEESIEGLDIIESSLLSLDVGAVDPDVINEIFRAAHSIKGGGATFGYLEISEFAHRMETLLDEVRQGERAVSTELVDLVLRSVDCIRSMVTGLENDDVIDTTSAKLIGAEIDTLLSAEASAVAVEQAEEMASCLVSSQDHPDVIGWQINVEPAPGMLKSGNEPTHIFAGLAELGELSTKVLGLSALDFDQADPEKCSLSWEIKLFGDVSREQIDELFAWCDDECDLEIAPLRAATSTVQMLVIPPASESSVDKQANTPQPPPRKQDSGSIRVAIDKVDALINLVGELVITQSMLNRFGDGYDFTKFEALKKGLEQLSRNTRELQESVMQIRMMPISVAFARFPRLVRDSSRNLGKNVELRLSGEATELDKTVLEKIGDPLVHLVRNSLDHGLESPEARALAGKPAAGILALSAYHEGGNIVITVMDDGAGIDRDKVLGKAIERGLVAAGDDLSDEEVDNLIFVPGFSTVDTVSDLSGRGVGMDVVRRNIADLGGHVSIQSSPGRGSTFTIRLPLTLAILDGQLISVGDHTYIVPLISIVETVQTPPGSVQTIAGHDELYKLRDQYIPVIRLYELFSVQNSTTSTTDGLMVVVEANGERVGLLVDDLQDQQQVVIKSLETNFLQMQGISGATILGDGTVALILDVRGLIDLFLSGGGRLQRPAVA